MGSLRKREREKQQIESRDVGEQMRQKKKKREASGKEREKHAQERRKRRGGGKEGKWKERQGQKLSSF